MFAQKVKMSWIVFRTDASDLIGSGHVVRCRSLARELHRQGANVLFICRRQKGDIISTLQSEFRTISLEEYTSTKTAKESDTDITGRELYETWLGCNQADDASECLREIAESAIDKIDWLVVDHYGLDQTWEEQMREGLIDYGGTRVLAIDDLGDRRHNADILLDQNYYGTSTNCRYKDLVPATAIQLLGPHYAMMGEEYALLHSLAPARTVMRRLLVYFGAVDSENLMLKVATALESYRLSSLVVDIVTGSSGMKNRELQRRLSRLPNVTIHTTIPSLAGLIMRADLALGAGGSTMWERACLGLPSIIITTARNQEQISAALHTDKYITVAGSDKSITAEAITELILTSISPDSPVACGKALTDGLGAKRVALAMLGMPVGLKLSPAKASDQWLLLRWANDPDVRGNSFSPEVITEGSHEKWFKERLEDKRCLILIARDSYGCPVGQVRFDLQDPIGGALSLYALVDLSVDRCARRRGIGQAILELGLEKMREQWGASTNAVAKILTENEASLKTFRNAGFTVTLNRTLITYDTDVEYVTMCSESSIKTKSRG